MGQNFTVKRWGSNAEEISIDDCYTFFKKLHEDRLFDIVFYDGSVKIPSQFVDLMLGRGTVTLFIWDGNKPAAMVWLTCFQGRSALFNFSVFRNYFKHRKKLADIVFDMILGSNTGEEPYLKAVYGITPKPNRAAVGFAKSVGFKVLSELPYACEFKGKTVPGILTIKEG